MKFDDEYFRKKRDTDADAAAEDTEDAAENKKESKKQYRTPREFFRDLKLSFSGRIFRSGGLSLISVAAALVVVVLINLVVNALPSTYTKIDLTQSQVYNISDPTREFLDTVDIPVTIYLVCGAGSEDSLIQDFIQRYADACEQISIKTVDPVLQPDFTAQYTNLTLNDNSLIIVSEKRAKAIDYNDIYTITYTVNEETYNYEVDTITFNGEDVVTSGIKYVTTDTLPTVALITGHGEAELSDEYANYLSLENIAMQELNLLTDEISVDNYACVIIIDPTSDISADEMQKLMNYLDAGGRMLVYTEYSQTKDQPNFAELMAYYGMKSVDGYIVEGDSNYYYQSQYYLMPEICEHDITQPLIDSGYYVLCPLTQAIEATGLYRDTITLTPLLTTTDNAWIKQTSEITTTADYVEGEPHGLFNVAMLAEEPTADGDTRVIWYGAYSLLDGDTDQYVSGANSDLFVNSVAWLCEQEESVSVHEKDMSYNYVTMDSSQIKWWTAVVTAIIPLAVLFVGAVVIVKRRSR